ncbi:hypothetical protein [Aureibacter tunicatorum]|uniref:Uncharacterized protein n=1 Tax=Aureibacter tunicatorum TaxID=866807 RepID=A0AAE4BTS6_9BACT|nr:hypothetical protein [Aureibacter tunicatorum]MDR6241016.1 hypothetical protein [Aureibacter tunicatorum]
MQKLIHHQTYGFYKNVAEESEIIIDDINILNENSIEVHGRFSGKVTAFGFPLYDGEGQNGQFRVMLEN